jgi:O-antigen/teichoic acid export membrane protein
MRNASVVDHVFGIRSLVSNLDKRFSGLFVGTIWVLTGRLSATAIGMLCSVVVAKYYGADMLGIMALIQTTLLITLTISKMGLDTAVLKLIPEHVEKFSVNSAKQVYFRILFVAIILSLLMGAILFLLADFIGSAVFGKPYLTKYLTVMSIIVVFGAIHDINMQTVRGFRQVKLFAFMQLLPQSLLFSLLIIIMMMSSDVCDAPVWALLLALVFSSMITVCTVIWVFTRLVDKNGEIEPVKYRDIISLSSPMFLTASMNFIIAQSGLVIIGVFRSSAEVGYYSIAVKLATLTSFVLMAINSIVAPKFSQLFHSGRIAELYQVARRSTKLIFISTIPILVVLLLFGRQILSTLYGKEFIAAYAALIILIFGQFIHSISGSTGYFLNMTGGHKFYSIILAAAAVINAALGISLIPFMGDVGAAVSATISLIFWNLVSLIYIKRKHGINFSYIPL